MGKGVLICEDLKQAEEGLKEIMLDKTFGRAGNIVVIEVMYARVEISHPERKFPFLHLPTERP